MSDFWLVLQFTWIPFAGALLFSLMAAPLGSLLSLRDEILLGLALPPVGAAAIVFAVMVGVDPESSFPLYVAAVVAILAVSMLLPGRGGSKRTSARWRAVLLAGIFCAGEASALLMGAASPRVEAHVHDMLRGEVLAMNRTELMGFALLTMLALVLAHRFRGWLFALALDEESLFIRFGDRGARFGILFRVIGSLIIAAGVIWVGPLLTLGYLAIPTLLWERRAAGLAGLVSGVAAIGLLGTLLGFAGSIAVDMPPVPVVIAALFVVGGMTVLVKRSIATGP